MAVRMVITMAISLYTSRVVLSQLGITDFGIFIVVGGVTVIMSFFTSALSAAIQRYMNFELGMTEGKGLQQIFSASWPRGSALPLSWSNWSTPVMALGTGRPRIGIFLSWRRTCIHASGSCAVPRMPSLATAWAVLPRRRCWPESFERGT